MDINNVFGSSFYAPSLDYPLLEFSAKEGLI